MTSIGDKTGTCLKTGPVIVNLSAVGSNERSALWGVRFTSPTCLSTVAILLLLPGTKSLLPISFSTARTTPSLHRIPMAVPPFSTALVAYST